MFFHTYTKPENTDYKQFVKIPGDYFDISVNDLYPNKNPVTNIHWVLLSWKNAFVGFEIAPNDYDVYVRSRCDIQLTGKINFEDYNINDNEIYIPLGHDYFKGVNDQFAFGSYQVMKAYFSIFTEYEKLYNGGEQFHPESYVTLNLKNKGININRLSITNTILR